MRIRFDGITVAVTGAGHGFGRRIAHDFDGLGARVFACDLSVEELADTATGTGIAAEAFDLTAPGAARGWISRVEEASGGPVGVLVCNAGGVRGQVMHPLEEVPEADWHALFDINLHAAFNLCAAVAPGMKRAGTGRIVTVSSSAGLRASLTGIQAYCAAKHGLVGLTRQLCHELGPHGITVNSVAPGFAPTNPASIARFESYGSEGRKALLDGIALRRLGTAQDIANAVLFFASPLASWISGEVLSVNGGR